MTLLFTSLLIVTLFFSFYRIWRSRLLKRRKIILFANRFCIILLLGCAFFQPTFRFTRIAPRENRIPVLVDCSKSMQLFHTDSLIHLFSQAVATTSEKGNPKLPDFVLYGFGDSLRTIPSPDTAEYNDKSSRFPRYFNDKLIKSCKKVCVLSDGNWTNTVSIHNSIREKECYYIPLHQVSPVSFIRMAVPNTLHSVASQTRRKVNATIHGFTARRDTITVQCRSGSTLLSEKTIAVDSGFFTESQTLLIPSKKAGSHLLQLTATLGDTIMAKNTILHTISPANFSVYLYSASPSLDRRFLTLSFVRKKEWEVVHKHTLSKRKPDLLVLLSWDAHARQLMDRFPNSSTFFSGSLPCTNMPVKKVFQATPLFSPAVKHLLQELTPSDLPPLSVFLSCNPPPFTIQRILIAYDSLQTVRQSDPNNAPILFEAQYEGNLILAFAASGLWRWDFWPKSITANSDAPLFSDFLIDRMQELIQYNTNKKFYIFPDLSPVFETDSASFHIALPSYLYNYSSIHLHFSVFSSAGDTLYTTRRKSTPFHLRAHSLKIQPLRQGTYRYTCGVTSEKGTIFFEDSLAIMADNTEFQVLGQNTVMLEELAHPIPRSALTNIHAFFSEIPGDRQRHNELITHTITVSRSWLLLGLLFFLFGLEWILRRVWRQD